ncbi:MAG: hypothetical protein LDL22_00365 [Hyphomicrobiales bacterium]|nr:hypothetical protein [Hyphomicrobiales bacterium]
MRLSGNNGAARMGRVLGFLLAMASGLGPCRTVLAEPMQPAWSGMVAGAYIWDGLPEAQAERGSGAVARAAEILAENGLRGIRLIVNRQQLTGFGIDTRQCGASPETDCFLADPGFRKAIANPAFSVVAITLHEVALSGWKMADPAQLAQHEAASLREFRRFLAALLPILRDQPGKTIIIANREGDHSIYCGATARFIQDAQFRTSCLGETGAGRSGRLDARRDALIRWYRGRQREIEAFRAAHGLGNRLLHAVEFNTVHRMSDFERRIGLDLPQTLLDIVPQVKPDLCSYSAYSSFNNGYSFREDLATIRAHCGTAAIILGELGFSSQGRSEEKLGELYRKAIADARAGGVRAIFFWQGFESRAAGKEYGLFRRDGVPFHWHLLRPAL